MFVALLISNIGLREIQEMNNIFDNLTVKKKVKAILNVMNIPSSNLHNYKVLGKNE